MSRNCLANPGTVAALTRQCTYDAMRADGTSQRVYSGPDGRIYAHLDGETVWFRVYSWNRAMSCKTLQHAVRWLLREARERAEYFHVPNANF